MIDRMGGELQPNSAIGPCSRAADLRRRLCLVGERRWRGLVWSWGMMYLGGLIYLLGVGRRVGDSFGDFLGPYRNPIVFVMAAAGP